MCTFPFNPSSRRFVRFSFLYIFFFSSFFALKKKKYAAAGSSLTHPKCRCANRPNGVVKEAKWRFMLAFLVIRAGTCHRRGWLFSAMHTFVKYGSLGECVCVCVCALVKLEPFEEAWRSAMATTRNMLFMTFPTLIFCFYDCKIIHVRREEGVELNLLEVSPTRIN